LLTERSRSYFLGLIIKTGSAGRDRIILEKGIVLAIRILAQQNDMDETTRDLLVYIALSLQAIGNTIDDSVTAWEKRGYWLKADRYRMEWMWSGQMGGELEKAIFNEDWGSVTGMIAQIAQKLNKVEVPIRNRLGKPWTGCYQKLKNQE
jgi:hypothetical protein